MRDIQLIREILTVAILSALMALLIAAAFAPEKYGEWLRKIDAGRYHCDYCDQHWEHDYTEDL